MRESAKLCQAYCQERPDCEHWYWAKAVKECWLSGIKPSGQPGKIDDSWGVVTGPKNCACETYGSNKADCDARGSRCEYRDNKCLTPASGALAPAPASGALAPDMCQEAKKKECTDRGQMCIANTGKCGATSSLKQRTTQSFLAADNWE